MSKKYLSLSLALTVPMICLSMACGGGTPEAETPEGAATPETPAVPEAPATETPATETPAEGAAPPVPPSQPFLGGLPRPPSCGRLQSPPPRLR